MSESGFARRFCRSAATVLLPLAVFALTAAGLSAQSGDSEAGEVAAFGGGVMGVGSHPAVGGSVGLAFSRLAMLLVETSFSPLGSTSMRPAAPGAVLDASRLYDLNLGLHIRIPVRDRWAPYAILGGGALWNTFDQTVTGPGGSAAVSHHSNFDFGFHTGAGLRYYIRDNWGIRPEVKVVVSKQTYTRLSIGIFYVIPQSWP